MSKILFTLYRIAADFERKAQNSLMEDIEKTIADTKLEAEDQFKYTNTPEFKQFQEEFGKQHPLPPTSQWDNLPPEQQKNIKDTIALYDKQVADFIQQKKQETEFQRQEQDIQAFYAQEKAEQQQAAEAKQKLTANKTPFTEQDAATIINTSLKELQSTLAKNKLSPAEITFVFYNNGNIGVVSPNQKAANLLRQNFGLPIQLNTKQYLINAKKYFSTASIKYTVNI